MAINRRDRDFSKIINEVDVVDVPMHYIKSIKFFFKDGTACVVEKEQIDIAESIEQVVDETVPSVDELADMHIELDFEVIENDVTGQVANLLDRSDDEGKS
jgi:copper chaperone CopZ